MEAFVSKVVKQGGGGSEPFGDADLRRLKSPVLRTRSNSRSLTSVQIIPNV